MTAPHRAKKRSWAATTALSTCALLIAATLPPTHAADKPTMLDGIGYNGPESCNTKNPDGTVRAPRPGDCAQYGPQGPQRSDKRAKNVILIVGDGMGQQEITMARNYLHGAAGRFDGLDNLTSTGTYTHHSIDRDGSFNYVTDSAASATAWTTGTKTFNGAIGVDLDGKPLENLLEKAKKAGMRTGNVTTSEVQDATPAALVAHVTNRKCYGPEEEKNSESCQGESFQDQYRNHGGLGSISEQLVDTRPDLVLGGGKAAFEQTVSHSGPGKQPFLDNPANWEAGKTVLENAKANGYQVVTDKQGLDAITKADQDAPVLGLFHDKNMTTRFAPSKAVPGGSQDKPTECTTQDIGNEPELVDMANKAIDLLNDPTSDKGFFLQVESASIDKRSHAADSCGAIGEVERLNEVVKAAMDFAKKDGNTLVAVTADHAHSTQIVYDATDSVSATTRLKTADGLGMTLGYGTIPVDEVVNNPKASQQHNGSQLRVAAFGPGEENVVGQTDQTDLFFTLANSLGINDIPAGEGFATIPDNAKTAAIHDGAAPQDLSNTCYGADTPGPGDCAQFGKKGPLAGTDAAKEKAKNVILFIGDGTGDSELTSARNYLYGANGRFPGIDALPYTGSYTTFALNPDGSGPEYVTDSAASATGWATGTKSYNGAIGVDVAGNPVPNLIELAKAKGLKTGNVTTSEIQDATPAAVGAHALHRKCYGPNQEENSDKCQGPEFDGQWRENGGLGSISEQLIDTRADVTMGGGAKYMNQEVKVDGPWAGHQWTKGVSVLDNAKNQGFNVVTNRDELDAVAQADQDAPVLGLFSEKNLPRLFEQSIPTVTGAKEDAKSCNLNPERGKDVPTLADMTKKSLDLLQNDEGFFLQVESASIDKADHDADICGQIGEAYQLDQAVQAAREWVEKTGEPTLIVLTADHAHTSQLTANGKLTAGRTTKLTTVDGDDMTVNYATAKSNDDDVALGGQTHTGAQLRVAAEGPGAQAVVGQLDQTDIHYVLANSLDLYKDNPKIDLSSKLGQTQAAPASTQSRWWLVGVGVLVLVVVAAAAYFASRKEREKIGG
ncbi:alkaline phosphatase [Corynebacterium aquilae]|uniref:alkaline phosphatase n=1 Tax=Corynebacterium aquilae TaxID=203263 RepID=UPI000951EF52|nr:alkaline phosphatase [Corynebacterium aquilae]